MNKTYFTFLPLLCMFAAACDRNTDAEDTFVIDGEAAKLYVGRYMETTPPCNTLVNQILSDERLELLPEAVPVKKREDISFETLQIRDNSLHLTINLLLASRTALLEVDTMYYIREVHNTCNAVEYEYPAGTYAIDSPKYSGYSIRYDVTPESIHATYTDYAMLAVGPSAIIYELTDGVRHAKEILKTDTLESRPHIAGYSGKFKVTDTGIATMQNDDFTFEFDPASGVLKETEPENKEIGSLEPADKRVDFGTF